MDIKIIVFVAKAIHREKEVWLLKFPNDRKLLHRIRQIGYLKWSQTIGCWYGPGTEKFIEELRKLEGIQIQHRKYTPVTESGLSHQREKHQRETHQRETHQRETNQREKHQRETHQRETHQQETHPKETQQKKDSPWNSPSKHSQIHSHKRQRNTLKENSTPAISVLAQKDLESWVSYLQSRQYAPQTVQVYSSALRIFLNWIGEIHHREVRVEHVNNYMKHLVIERKVSRSYQNQHVNAIKSFYKFTISIHLSADMILRPRREYKLPHYLTREEVSKIFSCLGNLKHKAMLSLVYACGLRLGETIRIQITDIDASQRLLIVRQSKGNKDRVVPIPESILHLLNDYALAFTPKVYLFEGQFEGDPYTDRSLQQVFKGAVRKRD
ncbi:MAG: phage integrase N-terminal SAM-like domain-containing protein [Bacteroidetes bacterium]|nr:phage integrase N-terminal SAM-like domain-containing protein [Bacteroidota bacterium]